MNEQTVIQDFVEVQGALLKVFQSLANHKTPTKFLVQLGQSGIRFKPYNIGMIIFFDTFMQYKVQGFVQYSVFSTNA